MHRSPAPRHPLPSLHSERSRLLGSKAAGLVSQSQIEADRCKFRDLRTSGGLKFHFEYARANQLASGSLVHRKEMPIYTVPAVPAVVIVHPNHYFHLRSSPKTWMVRRTNSQIGVEVAERQFSIGTKNYDFGFGITLAQGVVGFQFQADGLGRSHRVLSREFHPLSAGADARFLREQRNCRSTQ